MNITTCPYCGGRVISISIGWKCESCQGFIDMRGQFHEHKEEPFMPPLTNADIIRRMSDEELARKINRLMEGELVLPYCRELPACDDDLERDQLIPLERCEACVLHWLQQPAEEDQS